MKYPDLDLTKVKLIGWGAGSAFRDFFPRVPLPLAYTVCPLAENHGKTLHGLEVKAPSALLDEDRENSLIVIYARFSSEIMSQIRLNLGDFRTIPAMRIGPSRQPADIAELQDLARGIQAMTVQRPTPRNPQLAYSRRDRSSPARRWCWPSSGCITRARTPASSRGITRQARSSTAARPGSIT